MLREEMCDRSVELEEAGLGEEEVLGACIEFLEDRLSQLYRELYEMEG